VAPALKLIPDQLPIPYPSFDLGWWLFQKHGDARPVEQRGASDRRVDSYE